MFSCEVSDIFRNIYFEEQLQKTASEKRKFSWLTTTNNAICRDLLNLVYTFFSYWHFWIKLLNLVE